MARAQVEAAKINQQTAMETAGADELMKYKQLSDQGVITEKEFKKKKQILG